MRKTNKTTISIFVVLALLATAFFVSPVSAGDQAKEKIGIAANNPADVIFYDVAWNENTWNYAIAVGENTVSLEGVIYRYQPSSGWTLLASPAGVKFYDVVYDTFEMADTFYVVGENGTAAVAGRIENAYSASPTIVDLTPPAVAQVFYGACFDTSYGTNGTLLAVGATTAGEGIIAYYEIGGVWSYNTTGPSDVLEAVTWDYTTIGTIFVVGYNGGAAIAYSYSYGSPPTIISVPSDAGAFYGIDWKTYDTAGYAVIVGQNTSGIGKAWKFDGFGFQMFNGVKSDSPILRDIDWDDNGNFAIMVGDSGAIYIHYAWSDKVVDWTDPAYINDIYGVSVKFPASPGYGLGVGITAAPVISYQVADSSTQITANTVYPHLNEIDFRDALGASKLNQQVDVGSTYYFFINASYSEGWGNVAIDIYAWYDFGNDASNYNDTLGKNINFKLHYEPDSTDPVNNSGVWTLVWPNTTEISLGATSQIVDDNPTTGTVGTPDAQDYFHLGVNITFGPQIRYAPGDGTWDAATNQSDRAVALNDPNSWNFNITIYDSVLTTASQSRYDEFGVFAYTEIHAYNNPTGSGPPGTTITLSPASGIGIRTNVDYNVTVNVTDLKNATGALTIARTNIEVVNIHTDASASTSDISAWTAFPAGTAPLLVWGNSTPSHMPPVDNGTWTAGYQGGYDSTTTYTAVQWRVTIPPTTPEDHFTATITYEITYP